MKKERGQRGGNSPLGAVTEWEEVRKEREKRGRQWVRESQSGGLDEDEEERGGGGGGGDLGVKPCLKDELLFLWSSATNH